MAQDQYSTFLTHPQCSPVGFAITSHLSPSPCLNVSPFLASSQNIMKRLIKRYVLKAQVDRESDEVNEGENCLFINANIHCVFV